jgi:arabinogalactan oligomer / maltooligosaccharide transport system permease protein
MNRGVKPSQIAFAIFAHLVLVGFTALTLYPVLLVLKTALSTTSLGLTGSPFIPLDQISGQNFLDVVSTTDMAGRWLFGRQLLNSLLIAAATTMVGVALACTAAYAFSRWTFPGKQGGLTALLVTQMFPGVVMAIPLYILLDKLHLLNSMTGLVLVYSTTSVPFCVFMMKGYFDTIPIDLEHAALVDGASRWTIFSRIVLPLARPALVVTALFSFMTAWNEFILAATFMGEERSYTLPVVLQRYVGDFGTDWPHFAAGAVIVSIPVMLLFFALQRHLVGGLTAGSVKG